MAKDLSPSTHPLTPPLTEEEWLDWLRLLRSRRVGVSTFFRLMQEYESAAAALAALPGIAADAGVENYSPASLDAARRELDQGRLAGARLVAFGSPDYPPLLADIPDPPPFLWVLGNGPLPVDAVAIVGARNASSLGTRMARRLAAGLGAEGIAVASGLARGVDTAAHLASLDTGTIAVMAGGVDVVYPAENAVLAQEIQDKGWRVSEMPPGTTPQARHFPRRNRIVSGLSRAVVVVEAAAKSGSLITARTALDQGRDVLAVPGHPFDARASGCNMLIRDGAVLVRSAEDVIEALAHPGTVTTAEAEKTAAPAQTSLPFIDLHKQILDRLGPSPVPDDMIIRDLAAPPASIAAALTDLEIDGQVVRGAGGMVSRVS
ncbi:DNA-protecting protein DprA [Alphaproteobacteria bacterium GH1-50]|uniref:DNA-protecting protein DprA n=1 Tax=Kangsaoukella pontilimi TaxID=2691042 RepID=A0A7C9MH43_9RHOB|nr:DNA-processing protein DprA [Kangsaoukella pontilimi]MXQ08756.1 DNA-protecting protein DprA [Kangsaoukella pontilimi]